MRFFNLLLLLLLTCTLTAQKARVNKRWLQEQDSTRQAEVSQAGTPVSSALNRGASLHVMPLSFINLFPRFRFGGQLKRERWSYLLDLETGSDYNHQLFGESTDFNYHFYGIRPEVRYDLDAYGSGFYVGFELPVTVLDRKTSGVFSTQGGDRVQVAEARQDRFRVSAIAKLGVQFLAGNHVLFDFYAGIGPAYREVKYTERVGEVIDPLEEFELGLFSDLLREGPRWVPELAAGVRMGWWF